MKRLESELEKYGCSDIAHKLSQFEEYRRKILEINETLNMTRITDPDEFETRHFVESLQPCGSEEFVRAERILDVGSGAGFPGVPMAIAFPEKEFVLLDSLAKRMDAVADICKEAGIDNVTCVHGRAEDAAREAEMREAFDLCVSRAVASLDVLCEYCLPFVKTGGNFAAFKGKGDAEELEQATKAIDVLGGGEITVREARPALSDGVCIYIKKENLTPDKYPRPAGKPSKKPIR